MKIPDPMFPGYFINVHHTAPIKGKEFYVIWRGHPGDFHFVCPDCNKEFFSLVDAGKHVEDGCD